MGVIVAMDTQQVELIGRHYLMAELLRAGLEVAVPIRDRGIDLIAYADIDARITRFVSCPIQMKATMGRSFSVASKYEARAQSAYRLRVEPSRIRSKINICPDLWRGDCRGGQPRLDEHCNRGLYTTTKPSARVVELLEPYRMTPGKWWGKITGVAK
jgi:hypothetical protein